MISKQAFLNVMTARSGYACNCADDESDDDFSAMIGSVETQDPQDDDEDDNDDEGGELVTNAEERERAAMLGFLNQSKSKTDGARS